MHRYLRSTIARLTVLLALTITHTALAQGVTGSAVVGTVTKPDGTPVEGAVLQLRNSATGESFNAVSSKSGIYHLDNIPAGGPYTLTSTAEGLQPLTQPEILLTLGQRLALDLRMRSAFVEEIAVTAPRLDALKDHNRTGPSTVMKSSTITELPLQGRNFTDLLSTDPRISGNSIAGQNNKFNNIQIDGGANNDLFGLAGNGTPGGQSNAKPLSIEAIQEFVVQISPFDVRQGMFAGGLVNAITKSGTNTFHGSVFGYYQNKSLTNQNSYFTRAGQTVYDTDPTFFDYSTAQFGATLGGPIVQDKVHFFIAADIQQKNSSFGNSFQIGGVDAAADRTRAGFDDSVAQQFASILKTKYGIDPGSALGTSLLNPDRNVFAKITASPFENSHLEISYNLVNANSDQLTRAPFTLENFNNGGLRDGYQLSNGGYGQANTTNTGRIKLTSNWDGGNVSNEFLGGVSIIRDARNLAKDLPLILVDVSPPGTVGNHAWLAAGGERFSQANILDQDIYTVQDNITLARDEHRFTLGTSNEFFKFRNVFLQAATGAYAFNSLADLDANNPAAFQRRFGIVSTQDPGTAKFNVQQYGFYAQDEWTVNENFSLNPGLRVDIPMLSKNNTNPAMLTSPLAIDTGRVPTNNLLWSPRVGFNWDVAGNADTIIRGGLGVFSGRPPYVWVSNAYTINGLSQVELDCIRDPNGATPATGVPKFTADPKAQPADCKGGTGTVTPPTNVGEIDYFDPNTKYPQNLRAALGADMRLPWGIVATADLLYTEDVNGWYTTDANLNFTGYDSEGRALYGALSGPSTAGVTAFRSTPNRPDKVNVNNAIEVLNKNGGHVGSATLQLQKQFSRRYGLSVAYTYARSYDRISLTSSQALSNYRFSPIDGDLANRNVRPSNFDRPHKITISGTAALPFGFGVGLTYVGQSGTPYTWSVNGDINGDGINGNDLPFIPNDPSQISLAPGSSYTELQKFISAQSCLNDAKGHMLGRGACRNPWQDFLDARLSWLSPEFVKGNRIEVQYDIFNVLNLLNSQWGHFNSVTGFETAPVSFLRAVDYSQPLKRPIYAFTGPSTVASTVYSPTLSRWRMQFGARYVF